MFPVNYVEHTYVETSSFDDTSTSAVEGIHVGFKYYNVSDVMTKRGWKEVHHESGYCIYEKGNYLVSFGKGSSTVNTIYIVDKRIYPSGYDYKANPEKDLLPHL